MIDIQSAKEKLSILKQQKKELCDAATASVKAELAAAEDELSKAETAQRAAYGETFKEMANELGKMQREVFLIFVIHGLTIRFNVNHAVNWIEVQAPESGAHEYNDTWLTYARDGMPRPQTIERAWEIIEGHAEQVGYEVNRD